MNRDEAIQRAEIAMAWARGEPVQCKRTYSINWVDIAGPEDSWCFQFFDPDYEWRIKPKPLEWWSFVSKANRPVATIIADEQPLSTPEGWAALGGRWVRMREVE